MGERAGSGWGSSLIPVSNQPVAGNALVSGILDVSQVLVGPFEGILNTNALTSGGSMLDVAAVVAFVGWTILELIVIWAVGIFRREPA